MSSVIHAYIATLSMQCKNPDKNVFYDRYVGMTCPSSGSFFAMLKDNGEELGNAACTAHLRERSYSRYRSFEASLIQAELSEFHASRSAGRH